MDKAWKKNNIKPRNNNLIDQKANVCTEQTAPYKRIMTSLTIAIAHLKTWPLFDYVKIMHFGCPFPDHVSSV